MTKLWHNHCRAHTAASAAKSEGAVPVGPNNIVAPDHTLAAGELLAEDSTAAPTDTKTSTEATEQNQVRFATTH